MEWISPPTFQFWHTLNPTTERKCPIPSPAYVFHSCFLMFFSSVWKALYLMLTSIRASFAALAWSSALLLLSLGEVDRAKVYGELEQAATLHIEWNIYVYVVLYIYTSINLSLYWYVYLLLPIWILWKTKSTYGWQSREVLCCKTSKA